MNKRNLIITLGLLIVFMAIFFASAHRHRAAKDKYITIQGAVFGTIYHIKIEASNDTNYQQIINEALDQVDEALSMFNENSIISMINRGDSLTYNNPHFEYVFNKSREVSEMTDGAFDITIAPVVNLWGFGFDSSMTPDSVELNKIMQTVGYKSISMSNHKVFREHPNTMLDASAVAKGYACDYVAQVLKEHGIKNLLVEIGGEVHAEGVNPQGEEWKIGINKPIDDSTCVNNEIERVVALSNMSLATSGNYRNFYIKNGKKYAHTIDPHTGHLVEHTLLSVTIVAQDCSTADALATACMVMGLEKSMGLCEKHHIPGFFITGENEDFVCHYTKDFEPYLVPKK